MGDHLYLWRPAGIGRNEMVTGFSPEGYAILTVIEDDVATSPLHLPSGTLAAIAEAVKPGPSSGEIARIEEALRVERARVDQVLDRMWQR